MDRGNPKPVPRSRTTPSSRPRRTKGDRDRDHGHDSDLDDLDEERSAPSQESRSSSPPKREELIKSKKKAVRETHGESSDLRRQMDRLERDLHRRDRELEEERQESERALESVRRLEKEKNELKRELEGVKEEAEEYRRALEDTSSKGTSRFRDEKEGSSSEEGEESGIMADLTVQQKNREIQGLLDDNERLEEDKKSLEEKLSVLTDTLTEATTQIESMTRDHFDLKSKLTQADDKIRQLEEARTILSVREKELLGHKERHDQYLDNLCNAVDIRVDVWKKIMFDKDEEIERLNSKISALMNQIPNTQLDSERATSHQLKKKLLDREHQIALLNEQLAQATEELEAQTEIVQSLHKSLDLTEDPKKTEAFVKALQNSVAKLEEKLEKKNKMIHSLEKEAEDRSHTLTSLLSRMSSYESGEYGLSEAVAEIKDLKTQLRIRDKHIEAVTSEVNVIQMQITDLQEENEMLRDKLGYQGERDLSKEKGRYVRSRRNELAALRSKVTHLEEEVVSLKTRNYSMKKQLQQYDHELALPSTRVATGSSSTRGHDRDHEGPADGQSVTSTDLNRDLNLNSHVDQVVRNLTGSGVKEEEWKGKYDQVLEENTTLRKGLHEILECMQKMTEEGSADITIQAPVLEELLREMSSRGVINYPFPITAFHLKVCNLEGKCSQLRDEIHRLRNEERQCRQELFEAQAKIKELEADIDIREGEGHIPPRSRSPSSRSRSHSLSRQSSGHKKTVSFHELHEEESTPTSVSPTQPLIISGRNFVLEDLQNELETLRKQNEELKEKYEKDRQEWGKNLQEVTERANAVIKSVDASSDSATQLKIEYLFAIKDNLQNEIKVMLKRLAEAENESSSRLSLLERFRMKALHQISSLQQVLETSVPLHLLHSAKKEIRTLSEKLEALQEKEATFTKKEIQFHKNVEEIGNIREERDKLEEDLSTCQARLVETAAKLDSVNGNDGNQEEKERTSQIQDVTHKRQIDSLKTQLQEITEAKNKAEKDLLSLTLKYEELGQAEKASRDELLSSVRKEEHDALLEKYSGLEEALVVAKDEVYKWREIADTTQNQIRALENIRYFDRMEVECLTKQVLELQSSSPEKAVIARAHAHTMTSEKEKHLAIQQVEKLLSKLAQLEAQSLQQNKVWQEREMALISMQTHVILRYRNLFTALHETQAPRRASSTSLAALQADKEALEMFQRGQKKVAYLEEQLLEERLKSEEVFEKVKLLEVAITSGNGPEFVFETMQKVQESRLEVSKWKRKAENTSRDLLSLQESFHRLEERTSELEEDRIKLEATLELKQSLTDALISQSTDQLQLTTMPSTMTLSSTSSTKLETIKASPSTTIAASTEEKESQTEVEIGKPSEIVRIAELEASLRAKEEALAELRLIREQQQRDSYNYHLRAPAENDFQEALTVARETITSLQERLRAKEDIASQLRRLLAETRSENTSASERHVQELKAMQMTVHQQSQAFARMKSTLSQPVKDTDTGIEGTIKDQLTRIHELEDEVNQLQHAMSNTASQLTAARSEAHRWRCLTESKTKELDSARDQSQGTLETMEELHSLQLQLKDTQKRLEESQRGTNARESLTELVNLLRSELEEKDKEILAYSRSLQNLKHSATFTNRTTLEEKLLAKDVEINTLKDEINTLQKTVATQQVRISKTKAINFKSGVSQELEELRGKHKDLLEEKLKLEKSLSDLNRTRDENELKRIKSAEGIAKWEESKKWKRSIEKLEGRVKDLEGDNDRLKRTLQNLRITITRMEKEKHLLETKLQHKDKLQGSSSTTSKLSSSSSDLSAVRKKQAQAHILTQGEIAKLKIEIQDLQELNEKIEFEGREEAEKLKMEVKLLKDRIVSQERQLTAYQVAGKGDARIIQEIEALSLKESQFQKEIRRLEEDNLHLNLQIEQLKLDSPRLRDRVHHLQKLVEALKAEKPLSSTSADEMKRSQRSLNELEKTIQALKQIIDKLQTENKKLKSKPSSSSSIIQGAATASTEKLRTSVDSMVEEKKELLDKISYLEHENEKASKKLLDASKALQNLEKKYKDEEKRAKSAEMKLRTLLDVANMNDPAATATATNPPVPVPLPSGAEGYDIDVLVQKMRTMQEEIDHKNRLLSAAKQSLRAAEKATAPKTQMTSPRAPPQLEVRGQGQDVTS